LKLETYTSLQRGTSTPRAVEYSAFARATSALTAAQQVSADESTAQRLEALHQNLMLWDTLFGAVADPGNQLPDKLRAQIAYLAKFTRHYTKEARRSKTDLQPLIDVNSAIMKGLRGVRPNVPVSEIA
jgi:flagellar protein FlaF